MLAHQMPNPLASILTAVHLLAAPGASEQSRSHAVEVIRRQVGHMSRLLDDLHGYSCANWRDQVLR